MKTRFNLSVVIATTVFMMVMSFTSVRAQFLYRDNHVFVGQQPSNYATVATASYPGIYIGPDYSIEYWDGGLNFWRPSLSTNPGNYKLFIGDDGNVGIGRKPTTYKLEVAGQVWTTAGLLITSDATQKKNIRTMGEQRLSYVTKLRQLQGKTYDKLIESSADNAAEVARMVASGKIPEDYAAAALAELNASKQDVYKSEYGFIAQDVQALFPELVEENGEGVTQATIAVYSSGGSVVKIFPLDAKAKSGSITLSASDLAKGVYVYNLTANGVTLGTKRMVNP